MNNINARQQTQNTLPRHCRPDQGTYPVGTTRNPERPDLQMSYADLNCNGTFDPQDSVILSQMDGRPQVTAQDADLTSKMLRVMGNRRSPDIDGDGVVSTSDRFQAAKMGNFVDSIDKYSDGVLRGSELTYRPKGGLIGIPKPFKAELFALGNDRNNDGKFSAAERPYNTKIQYLSQDTIQIQQRSRGFNPFADRPMRAKD